MEFNNVDILYEIKKSISDKPGNNFMAVKNVSFNLLKGETLGIVGGSGSGKSTLGKAIVGLIEKYQGQILYKGQNILVNKYPKDFRKYIQLVFQDPYSSLNPKIKVGDAIIEVFNRYKIFHDKSKRKKEVIKLLNDVHLDESFYNRYPHELSGGQRQRVVIARALAVDPEILICDESVSALDVSIQAEVLNLINEIKLIRNLSLIFISHDLSVVKYMSDRVMILKNGNIEEIINAELLFKSKVSEYTRQLIEALNFNS